MTRAAGTHRAAADAGFTLVESLVAMAVLAISAVALLAATEAHLRRLDGLESRILARFAAENLLAERELGLGADRASDGLLGHGFDLSIARTRTADPDLVRLDVTVTEPATGATFRGTHGFLASAGEGSEGPPP